MRSHGWLVGICWLFFTGIASAQPGGSSPAASAASAGMDEDIEIMRRIMDRAVRDRLGSQFLGGLISYEPNVRGQTAQPMLEARGNVPGLSASPYEGGVSRWVEAYSGGVPRATGLEGAYLKGYGVVFTMTLPPMSDPGPRVPATETKVVKEWERVRQQVRGQKPQPQPTEQPGKSSSLADVLLKVLADNGHNFAKLAEEEKLTVVVTFRQHVMTRTANVSGSTVRLWASSGREFDNPAADLPAPAKDNIVLGDLNLRQGRFQEAIKDYLKAAQALGTADPAKWAAPDLARKLAQAYLGASNIVEAKRWLEIAGKIDVHTTKQAPATPSRLTITAGKSLLDRVGSGKMSFDEFRRAATVEHRPAVSAAAPAPKKGEPVP